MRLSKRAEAFATGHISGGDNSGADRAPLEHGWMRGYQAALTDVRRAIAADRMCGFELRQLIKPRRNR